MRLAIICFATWVCWGQDIYLNINWSPQGRAFGAGQMIAFTASNGLDARPLVYSWDFGDGTQASGAEVGHAFDSPGRYGLSVFGTTDQGEVSQTYYATLFVNPNQGDDRVNVFITQPEGDLVARAGTQVQFEADSDWPLSYVFWEVQGTDITHEGNQFELDLASGLDDVYLNVNAFAVNADGFATDISDYRALYVYSENAPPDAIVTEPSLDSEGFYEAALGETVRCSVQGSDTDGPSPISYYWEVSGPSQNWQLEGLSVDVTVSEAGAYYVYCVAVDGAGGYDPFPPDFYLFVRGENQPPAIWTQTGSLTAYAGETIELVAGYEDPEQDPVTFVWDLGDGRTVAGETAQVDYPTPGPYQVTLIGTDALGAVSNPFSIWVLVNPDEDSLNQAPQPAIIRPQQGAMFASGDDVQFEGLGYDIEKSELSYFWSFSDGTLAQTRALERTLSCEGGDDGSCLLDMECFVRDDQGWFSWWGDSVEIAIYRGDRPPDGKITSPVLVQDGYEEPVFQLRPGESVTLKGDPVEGTRTGKSAVWRFYGENDSFTINGFETGPIAFEDLPQAGNYDVYFHVADAQGREDPIPAWLPIWARDSNRPPVVDILEPGWDISVQVGDRIGLVADGYDDDGDAISYEWVLSDGRTFVGRNVDEVEFGEPGLYQIALIGRDGEEGGASQDPMRRYVVVHPEYDPLQTYPPDLVGLSPGADELVGPAGTRFSFAVAPAADNPEPLTEYFWDFGNGMTQTVQNPGQVAFNEPGFHLVRAFARGQSGLWSSWPYYWVIYIYGANVPPEGEIIDPPRRDHPDEYESRVIPVLQNTPVTLEAVVVDPDGNLPLSSRWWLDGEPYSTELKPEPLLFEGRGRHQIELYVSDANDLEDPFIDYRQFQVVDPDLKPQSYIAYPDGDITVEPGEELYFFGFGEDPNELELTYAWEFGPEASIPSATGEDVYPVVYTQESPPDDPYRVSMTAHTQFTQDPTPATLRVTVRQYRDSDFEPNDSLDQARSIQKGTYSDLILDAAAADGMDVFRITVDEDGRDLELRLKLRDPGDFVDVEIYRLESGEWVSVGGRREGFGSDSLTIQDVSAGEYAIEVGTPSARKRRDPISYGMGVNSRQPAIYLPFLVEDGVLSSLFSVINPYDEAADVVVVGLDQNGQTVATRTRTIEPYSQISEPSVRFFGTVDRVQQGRAVKWLKIQASRRLLSYMEAETQDGSQLLGIEGISALSASVMVPHIAVRTDQWYTRAITVNAVESSHAIDFEAQGAISEVTAPAAGNVQTDFRFSQMFESLPEWGRFSNRDHVASLAGVELFGRVDGARQVAALNMIGDRLTNPNFFQLDQRLYFPHVAKDRVNFWTGISLINPNQSEVLLDIVGVDDSGEEIARLSGLRLEPQGKLLNTVSALFPDSDGISWLRVETTQSLMGFALFGDHTGRRLAGFETPRYAVDELYFPKVRVEPGRYWTGIALLNIDPDALGVTVEAYSATGALLASQEETLDPGTKLVRVAESIFDAGLPTGVSYLRVKSPRAGLVGFELFGSLQPDGGLGDQFAGILALAR